MYIVVHLYLLTAILVVRLLCNGSYRLQATLKLSLSLIPMEKEYYLKKKNRRETFLHRNKKKNKSKADDIFFLH